MNKHVSSRVESETAARLSALAPAVPRSALLRRLLALGLEAAEREPARLLGASS